VKNGTAIVDSKSSPLKAYIRDVSLRGLVKVRFADKIKVPPNFTQFNYLVMEIKVLTKGEEAGNKAIESWNITGMTSEEMQI
jgi:hypothetical protein